MSREHAGARTKEGQVLIKSWIRLAALPGLLVCAALCGCAADGPPRTGEHAGASTAATAAEIVPAGGGELLDAVRASDAQAIVLNVWATWCGPCREEFPDLLRLREAYLDRGVELVLVSGDFDDQLPAARSFLNSHGVDFRTYIKTGRDMEFIDALNPEWSGALPATMIYDAEGHQQAFWEGKASYEEMEQRLLSVLEGQKISNL